MRAALALPVILLVLVSARAQAAIRTTQGEIEVEDARESDQVSLDLDLMDGRRIVFHLACRGNGRTVLCRLSRKDQVVGTAQLDPNAALTDGSRLTACQAAGVRLTLSVSDLIQTLPDPIADSYRFRVTAEPIRDQTTVACPRALS